MKASTIKRVRFISAVALFAAAVWSVRTTGDVHVAQPVSATGTAIARPQFLVAPGRIEPVSEEIEVSSELPGTLSAVPLKEGDRVHRGQVIAELLNEHYKARIESAAAQVQLREAELSRVVNGSTEQERREALALVREAEAVLSHAETERQRYRELYRTGDISKSRADTADREYAIAKARCDAARERHALVNAAARDDDRTRAEAAVSLAQKNLAESRAMWERTRIRAPIDGIVIRTHLHAGESVSELAPGPIYTLADDSGLRARVEIDERDIELVRPGQTVSITADAYRRTFEGRVVRVGRMLGRKRIRTDEPTERVDQKILEALVDLAPDTALPIGLRVICRIQVQ